MVKKAVKNKVYDFKVKKTAWNNLGRGLFLISNSDCLFNDQRTITSEINMKEI